MRQYFAGTAYPSIRRGKFNSPGIYLSVLFNIILRHLDSSDPYCAVSYLLKEILPNKSLHLSF